MILKQTETFRQMLTEEYTLELAGRTRQILIDKDIDTQTDRDRYS